MDFRDKLKKAMEDLNLNQRQIAGMTRSSKAAAGYAHCLDASALFGVRPVFTLKIKRM